MKDEDMARFAALGYPAQVQPIDDVEPEGLVDSLRRVLEAPSARLLEAAVLTVRWLAKRDALNLLHKVDLSPEATRRLGFLADKLGQEDSLSRDVQKRLDRLASTLHREGKANSPPLTFKAVVTDT